MVVSDDLMSADIYYKTQKAISWLKILQAPGDANPQMLKAGTGEPYSACHNVREALAQNPNAQLVRGYRMRFIRLKGDWSVTAVSHVVTWRPSESDKGRFQCHTRHYERDDRRPGKKFLFVPSSRMHVELSDEQLLSGRWILGIVYIGSDLFCTTLMRETSVQGRMKSVIGRTPQTTVAKRCVQVLIPQTVQAWMFDRLENEDFTQMAEMIGLPCVEMTDEDDTNEFRKQAMTLQNMAAHFAPILDATTNERFESLLRYFMDSVSLSKTNERYLDAPHVLSTVLLAEARQKLGIWTPEETKHSVYQHMDDQKAALGRAQSARLRANDARERRAMADDPIWTLW